MKGCGFCDSQAAAVELNDDGVTYDLHLPSGDGHQVINVDFETLVSLEQGIQTQMFFAKELKYDFVEDEDDE